MIFALIGNQNCGKTTLFNALTGANQHVGNFPGVTVEQKTGIINNQKDVRLVDLPGIYSLRPYSAEEIVTRDFILNENPDGIINIVDATNIERNLYLTLQLLELQIPTVIALNMMDEVRNNGGRIDINKLTRLLGVPVIPISAAKKEGISELTGHAIDIAEKRILPQITDFFPSGPMQRCIHTVSHYIEKHASENGLPPIFSATRLMEGDTTIADSLAINSSIQDQIERTVRKMENETKMDRNAALADGRYAFIEKICAECVVKSHESKEHKRSIAIDKILTGKYTAIPAFLLIISTIFFLTFNVIGRYLSDLLSVFLTGITEIVYKTLTEHGINPVIRSLVTDGIFSGVGSVLSFLPIIVVLFFFLSLLEDTGYMARVAFVMDEPLRKIGLSGRSFVPMFIGFGCSVPAIMATRTLSSARDRKMTVLLTPFVSCSAKIPIYTVFISAFFKGKEAFVLTGIYVCGILLGIISALILNKTVFKGEPVPFVMELPNYSFPSFKSIAILMKEKAKDFIQKAFTVIFIASVIIWFLQTFDTSLNIVSDNADSLLALTGKMLSPLLSPLGFGDWRIAASLLSGFTAKEAVVSTMSVLLNVSTAQLSSALSAYFTPVSAISFLLFSLLYTPCAAAVAAIKRELGSGIKAFCTVILQCGIAWGVSFIIYNTVNLFM